MSLYKFVPVCKQSSLLPTQETVFYAAQSFTANEICKVKQMVYNAFEFESKASLCS